MPLLDIQLSSIQLMLVWLRLVLLVRRFCYALDELNNVWSFQLVSSVTI